jgi:hypothetical protein
MDSKGARELARLLSERHGVVTEPVQADPIEAEDAAPIFHWLGIEPPAASGSSETDDA